MSLHDKILNIPCEVDKAKNAINRIEYQKGHRDARHKAAELVISYDELLEVAIDMQDYINCIEPWFRKRIDIDYINDVIERYKNE